MPWGPGRSQRRNLPGLLVIASVRQLDALVHSHANGSVVQLGKSLSCGRRFVGLDLNGIMSENGDYAQYVSGFQGGAIVFPDAKAAR
jgi:hypothetical protein